jgi:hypothetical protein
MRSKVSDVRFISHGISPSGIISNDRFRYNGVESRQLDHTIALALTSRNPLDQRLLSGSCVQ